MFYPFQAKNLKIGYISYHIHQFCSQIILPKMRGYNEDEQKQFLINHSQIESTTPPQQPIQLQPAKPTPEQTPRQIIHKVQYDDTLEGLSLQYSVPISKIRNRNHIDGDYILHLKEIIIPNPQTIPISKQRTEEQLIEEFVGHMNYSEKDRKVAKYYLLETDWDMNAAIQEYREDLKWQRQNKKNIEIKQLSVNKSSEGKEIARFYELQQLRSKKIN